MFAAPGMNKTTQNKHKVVMEKADSKQLSSPTIFLTQWEIFSKPEKEKRDKASHLVCWAAAGIH